ncbi:phage tail protein [Rhodobacter veldkampii DSM 11550]|uniref:Phage tail protein n=1 Tax=Phaeovulum veldkampii DSM 11550 TaxID=1185920 RepID=A0A2T4JMY6_9RHOB|nr:head-tail adaptor protein [Phaeovulum veldkampii]MBK5944918.1 phage tail protein [Phaeovulum veldkampii DSM 11550]PTE19284.1 phage tail protein [Phaeovulum veldkampii DSM 11550]TDQ62229.1 head-tail adaptor [Phaeovulum veldkampii DSM 11550]
MSAPRLNRRLVLEEARRVPDGAGGHVLDWVGLGEVWAEVRAGAGRERAGELLTLALVAWRITLRAAPEGSPRRPRPEQRLREGGRVFRILAVAEADPGARYLTCFAQEEVVA